MLSPFVARLKALLFRRSADAELDEELRYHLERETERNLANGMSETGAYAAARRAFGNVTVATEQARDATRWRGLEEFRQDVFYALRTFKRAPLFVLTVVATIGLGLGLLSSAFTFFDAYVLRPLAVRDPHSLFELNWSSANGRGHRFTLDQYQRLRAAKRPFSETFAFTIQQARVRGRPAIGQLVSGNFFDMLGVPPAIGRTLLPSDDEPSGASAVIVISHHLWRTVFGADSSVIGQRLNVNGTSLAIVGVAREGFGGLTSSPFDFWVPLSSAAVVASPPSRFRQRSIDGVSVIGRLAPGVPESQAATMFNAWMVHETAGESPPERASGVDLTPRGTSMPRNPEAIGTFAPVLVAFLLVMLIACANVANIMLARGMARQREIGIRLALGSGRGRLIKQLLTEAVLLAVPAGVVGYAVSRAAIWISLSVMYTTVPAAYAGYLRLVPLDADARVLGFMIVAALGAAIVFGLAPALQATRPNIVQASRGDFDTQFRPSRLRNALVVAQVTLSVLLLICAGVLLAGARRTERLEPGIRTRNIVQVETLARFRARALDVLRAEPVVRDIASSTATALDGAFSQIAIAPAGRPSERIAFNIVSANWFAVLDLPIESGRSFTDAEARARAPVTVVSHSAAAHFWPGGDAIGQTVRIVSTDPIAAPYRTARVIGVTRDVSPGSIAVDPRTPVFYYPQPPDASVNQVLLRVNGDAGEARATLERALAKVDSGAVVEMHTLEASLALQVYPFRALYWIASAIGVVALVLTLIGVYGVMSYLVAQRKKEFGIRLALGASGSALVGLVLRESLRLSVIGILAGVVLAAGVSQLFGSMLYNLDMFNLVGYAGGVGIVLLACLIAAYAPSRRAASVNPVEALRADS